MENLLKWKTIRSSLTNNCADGINVQAGKNLKFDKYADWNKYAGRKTS